VCVVGVVVWGSVVRRVCGSVVRVCESDNSHVRCFNMYVQEDVKTFVDRLDKTIVEFLSQQRSHPPPQPSSQPSTHPSTQPSTQQSTHPSTHPSTQPSTQQSTHPSTHPSTQPSTQHSTQHSTHASKGHKPSCLSDGEGGVVVRHKPAGRTQSTSSKQQPESGGVGVGGVVLCCVVCCVVCVVCVV